MQRACLRYFDSCNAMRHGNTQRPESYAFARRNKSSADTSVRFLDVRIDLASRTVLYRLPVVRCWLAVEGSRDGSAPWTCASSAALLLCPRCVCVCVWWSGVGCLFLWEKLGSQSLIPHCPCSNVAISNSTIVLFFGPQDEWTVGPFVPLHLRPRLSRSPLAIPGMHTGHRPARRVLLLCEDLHQLQMSSVRTTRRMPIGGRPALCRKFATKSARPTASLRGAMTWSRTHAMSQAGPRFLTSAGVVHMRHRLIWRSPCAGRGFLG